MPSYVYRCPNGHTLEDFEPMSAPTERPCEECNAIRRENDTSIYMTRVIGPGGGVIWKQGPPTRRFHK